MTKDLEYYLGLSYPVLLRKISDDGEEYYFAEVPDLPGCMAHGNAPDEAFECLEGLKRLWIEEQLNESLPVPEPRDLEEFSGKFVVRLPKQLHRDLTVQAKRNGVSLNSYVNNSLSRESGKEDLKDELKDEIRKLIAEAGQTVYYARRESKKEYEDPGFQPFKMTGDIIWPSGAQDTAKVLFNWRHEESEKEQALWGYIEG